MSLLFAAALLASAATTTVPSCSWDKPGMSPFMGDVVASVDRYTDIPLEVRAKLKQRMAARQYDEFVTIQRDAIVGKQQYAPEIREMHFGDGRVCRTVTRSRWASNNQERGLVYCESGECLLVPTVCRNLSRITRVKTTQLAGAQTGSVGPLEPLEPIPAGPFGLVLAASPVGGPLGGGSQVAGDTVVGMTGPDIGPWTGSDSPGSAYPTFQGPAGTIVLVPPFIAPAVPEPPVALLWLLGAGGLAGVLRWRRRQAAQAPVAIP